MYRPLMEKIRSTVSNNLVFPDVSAAERLQDSGSGPACRGPLCKSFICYVENLPIGHGVQIQLKAFLRFSTFQSVREPFSSDSFDPRQLHPQA
jgi:hypothetical protein